MTLKKRLDKLEPALEKAWVKAWEEALIPPELSHFEYKARHMAARLQSMSPDELAALDERFGADQEQYPALKAWNDPSFQEWLETFCAGMSLQVLILKAPTLPCGPTKHLCPRRFRRML